MDKGAILLNDMVGEKSESMLGGMFKRVVGRKQSTRNLLRGELLEQIPGEAIVPRSEGQNFQKPFNYHLLKDPSVAVYCGANDIAPLSENEYLLLQAIQSQSARYEVFIAGNKLEWGCGLKRGDPVYVSIPGVSVIQNRHAAAVVRYVGGLPPDPGLMFGIEITDVQYRGCGTTDGTFHNERYFVCDDKCGVFVALDKLAMDPEGNTLETPPHGGQSYAKAASHGSAASSRSYPQERGGPADNTRARSQAVTKRPAVHDDPLPRFKKGDRVVAFDNKGNRIHGTVRWVGMVNNVQHFIVGIETDVTVRACNFEGALPGMTHYFAAAKNHHLFMLEIGAILSEEESAGTNVDEPNPTKNKDVENTSILAKEMGMSKQLKTSQATAAVVTNPLDRHPLEDLSELGVGSTVQISDPPRYGVIKWIGELPNVHGLVAGVELEEYMEGCSDGTWQEMRYFMCPYGRGFFCPHCNLRPDQRFSTNGTTPGATPAVNPLVSYPLEERADQTVMSNQMEKYLGDERGIQGHQNSCYLDATVFGLFGLSNVFDFMFLKSSINPTEQEVSKLLWKHIVNPLRKNGVVRYESVMQLRNKLEEHSKMKGIAQDEKDPEEFLIMLLKHTLHVEPFISIRYPIGTEQEYIVQLCFENNESMRLPTMGDLLTKTFKEQNMSFTELPSKLFIQVPKFGKQIKGRQKIVPDLSLDIMDLTVSPNSCFICGESAWWRCAECMADFEDPVYFCRGCSGSMHGHPHRKYHKVEMLQTAGMRLELLSMICIETSHYVCFTRAEERWIFFDSMANQVGTQMGRRSPQSKREKRRQQKVKRRLKFSSPPHISDKSNGSCSEDTVDFEHTQDNAGDAEHDQVSALGVDLTAVEMKLEDTLKDTDSEYSYEYLFECRKRLCRRLENCRSQLEKALSINASQVFKHRKEIESIRHFYQTIAYASSRTGQLVRNAKSTSSVAATIFKELRVKYGQQSKSNS